MAASFLLVPDRTNPVTAIPTESKKRELRWT
jgi:hypothetical protein